MEEMRLRGASAALFTCTDREVVTEGRAGTSKTTGALVKLLYEAKRYPGMRVLLCRQTRESMTDSTLVTFERLVGESHPEVLRVKREQRHIYRLFGSEFVCGGLDKPKKLFSTEWDRVYVNEAVEISEDAWELFGRSMRHNKTPYHQRIADVNPDAPGHWINKRAHPCEDRLRHIGSREDYNRLQAYNHGPQIDKSTGKPARMRRLVSVHQDNPAYFDTINWRLTPAGVDYVGGELEAFSGFRRQRMLEGLWVAAEGVVYPEFDDRKHVVQPFGIPEDWPIYVGIDPGYDCPACILWIAVAPNGTHYVFDEIYQGGQAVSVHCKNIHARNAGRTVRRYLADPQDAFKKTMQSPKSIAQQARECGLIFTRWPRSDDVDAMVNAVRERLLQVRIKVFSTCTQTINEFQSWRFARNAKGEPLRGDEQYEKGNDHAMDVIKGMVAAGLENLGRKVKVSGGE